MAAWSNRGCDVLADYLEKDGRGSRVKGLVVGADMIRGAGDRNPTPAVVLRLLEATPNLAHLFITLYSGDIKFLRLVPYLSHLSLRAASSATATRLLLLDFARCVAIPPNPRQTELKLFFSYPNVLYLHLTGIWALKTHFHSTETRWPLTPRSIVRSRGAELPLSPPRPVPRGWRPAGHGRWLGRGGFWGAGNVRGGPAWYGGGRI